MSLNSQIADLILEKGRAQAQGALGSGQAWSGALSQIGQSLGQSIASIPKIQEQAAKTAEEQRARAARDKFASLLKETPLIEQNGAKIVDLPTILNGMNSSSFGPEGASAAQHVNALNEGLLQVAKGRQMAVTAAATGLRAAGNSDKNLALHVIDLFDENHTYPSRLTQQWRSDVEVNPSTAIPKLTAMVLGAPKLEQVGPDVSLIDPTNPSKPVFTGPPKPGEGQHVINGQVVDAAGKPVGEQVPKQATPLTDEEKKLKEGQLAEITAKLTGTIPMSERDRGELQLQRSRLAAEVQHWKATEAAANPLAGMASAPQVGGADQPPNLTGDAVLKNLAPPIAAQVKALADGKMQFPSGFALKSPYWQTMLGLVAQYDPSFDATNYNNRAKTRADFSSGKSAQTINTLNTVAQHLDRLSTSAEGLNNSSLPAYNTIANLLSKASGNPSVTKFETDKKAVVDELTRAWRQSGGTESDIKSWSSVLDAASSPAQLHTAIAEMGNLLEGKLSAMETQLQQGMGKATDLKAITPEARTILEKLKGKADASPAAAASVPDNVATALKGATPGKHTLSDGSVWTIASDGSITKGS